MQRSDAYAGYLIIGIVEFPPDKIILMRKDNLLTVALHMKLWGEDKRLYEETNARHYDIYTGEHFKQVVSIQTEWFKTYSNRQHLEARPSNQSWCEPSI